MTATDHLGRGVPPLAPLQADLGRAGAPPVASALPSTPHETWLPIPGFDGYEASTLGRIRSFRARGTGGKPLIKSTRRLNKDGYPVLGLHVVRRRTTRTVHQLVALTFLGPCPEGLQVRHLDGDKTNARPANLRYGTQGENNRDQVTHGTHRSARKTHCANGHPFDEANTAARPGGWRNCRACARERHARWLANRNP